MRKAPILVLSSLALAAALQAEAQTAPAAKHGGYSGGRSHVGVTHHGGGYRHYGGHRHYYSGYRGWGWGLPLAVGFGFGSYFGYPYYGSYWDSPRYYGAPTRVVYRDVVRDEPRWVTYESNPQLLPEREMERRDGPPPADTGAPTGRPLYQNYCEATQAYYPKVQTCASGWILRAPRYN